MNFNLLHEFYVLSVLSAWDELFFFFITSHHPPTFPFLTRPFSSNSLVGFFFLLGRFLDYLKRYEQNLPEEMDESNEKKMIDERIFNRQKLYLLSILRRKQQREKIFKCFSNHLVKLKGLI